LGRALEIVIQINSNICRCRATPASPFRPSRLSTWLGVTRSRKKTRTELRSVENFALIAKNHHRAAMDELEYASQNGLSFTGHVVGAD